MSPNRLASFRLEEEILAGLQAVQERDGVPKTEQVRRALRAWLTDRGVLDTGPTAKKMPRKRAATRRRT
jgi:hypothetical protein